MVLVFNALLFVAVLLVVCTFLWVAVSRRSSSKRDDGDEDGGGGGGGWPRHPIPPAPPEPTGCSPIDWADFDQARESWGATPEHPSPREPAGA